MMHSVLRWILTLTLLFVIINFVQAQRPGSARGGLITGLVIADESNVPVEYAYIILYSEGDSTQVTGTVTDSDGRFLIRGVEPGNYFLDVTYMGYDHFRTNGLQLGKGKPRIDLGEIRLQPALMTSEEIEITADKAAITYQIDKKVINVAEQQTAISGTAVEVLENVPSVTVDIEGNVLLRGSSSYVVLLDDKPTVLEPNEVLQQIPASTIENIEIITNPSAKFDPDGTSGIINIVTKKDQLNGVSGIINIDTGVDDKYGANILLNFRGRKTNSFLSIDYNQGVYPGSMQSEYRTTLNDTNVYINSSGNRGRNRTHYSLRGGVDYYLSKQSTISLGFRYGGRAHGHDSKLDYHEWEQPGSVENFYISRSESERSGDFYAVNLDYRHQFAQKGHKLLGQIIYQYRGGEEESVDELTDMQGNITNGRKSTEKGPGRPLRIKVDYTLPLGEETKFEAGYQSRIGRSEDINELYEYNTQNNRYEIQPQFGHETFYHRNIQSLYGIYAGAFGSFGYQGGFRGEYTYRRVELKDMNRTFSLNRWDFYPTVHFSYQFSKGQQTMLSYTRRIERPRGYYFEPFETWMDAYNVRRGNPDLKPEYIDSYELGYQTFFGKNLFSIEAYYRVTSNKIERVRSLYTKNITLHTIENVGNDYTFGSELMLNMDVFKFWNVNLMGNLYNYRIEGQLLGRSFSRESFNWSTRFNNTIKLWQDARLQSNAIYNSPSVSSQGSREGYFMFNFGLRQEFFNKTLAATLQIRDAFSTSKWESESEGFDFYSRRVYERKAPIVMLNLSYKINNYKQKRERNGENGDFQEEGDEF